MKAIQRIILITIITGNLFAQQSRGASSGRVTTVFTEPLIEHELFHRSLYGGRIEPIRTFPQPALVSGIIRSINVRAGDYVQAGDLLYTIQQIVVAQNYLPTPIYAQNSGMVVSVDANVGERVQANATVVTLADTGRVKISFYVSEQDFISLRRGDTVYLSSRINQANTRIKQAQEAIARSNDDSFIAIQQNIIREQRLIVEQSAGVISSLPLIPNYQTGLYTVEATFTQSPTLFFGKFERVELRINRTVGLAVSQSLLQNRYGRNHLFMVDENNVVYLREVEIGQTFGDMVTIIAGAQAGEHIIVRASGRYQIGDTVQVAVNES